MSGLIFVHGATGNLGGLVIDQLLRWTPPSSIVAGVRDINSDAAKALGSRGIQLRVANLEDKSSLEKAYANIETLIYIPIGGAALQRATAALNSIAAAQSQKVKRYVQVSWGNGRADTVNKITPPYLLAESALRQSGLAWVIARNGIWIDNYFPRLKEGLRTGSWSAVAKPGTFVPWISRPDTARAIAAVALNTNLVERVLHFNHNVAVTYAQVAEILSEIKGSKVEFAPCSVDELATFLQTTLPAPAKPMASVLASLFSSYDYAAELGEYPVSNDVFEVTSKSPESIKDYIKRSLLASGPSEMQ